jgi:hypothetical protein
MHALTADIGGTSARLAAADQGVTLAAPTPDMP